MCAVASGGGSGRQDSAEGGRLLVLCVPRVPCPPQEVGGHPGEGQPYTVNPERIASVIFNDFINPATLTSLYDNDFSRVLHAHAHNVAH